MKAQSRWFLAIAALAALLLAGCTSGDDVIGGSDSSGANVRFVIGAAVTVNPSTTDDGDDSFVHHDMRKMLQSANVTFSSILARNLSGELIDVSIELPVTVDLLAVMNGRSAELPMGSLPPGTYDQLVVVMTAVQLVTADGTTIDITPPGGGFTAIVNVCPFEVIDGDVTTVQLRFRGESFRFRTDHGFSFHPEFECDRP